MTCIIIEDQLPAQRILKKYISDLGSLELIATYTNAIDAMEVLKSKSIDIIFLDLHLPKLSGMDFLKNLNHPPEIILTTAFQDYALESYEYHVVDYLLKPFSFQRFIKAVTKAEERLKNKTHENFGSKNEIYIKSGYEFIRVNTNDVFYLVSDAEYTAVHLSDKKLLSSEPLKYWEEALSKTIFMRIHKSYIINTKKIAKVSGNKLYLINDSEIPIGRAYKNEFSKIIKH